MDCDIYMIWLDRLHFFINTNSNVDCDVYAIWLDRRSIVGARREKRKKCGISIVEFSLRKKNEVAVSLKTGRFDNIDSSVIISSTCAIQGSTKP